MSSTSEKHILDSIIYHRRWWRLSQRNLAAGLRWSPNAVQRIESGYTPVTLAMLLQMAAFFNESLAEFVSEDWSEKLRKWNELQNLSS